MFIKAGTGRRNVEIDLVDEGGELVLRVVSHSGAVNLLDIDKLTGKFERRCSVDRSLGFELDERGKLVIH